MRVEPQSAGAPAPAGDAGLSDVVNLEALDGVGGPGVIDGDGVDDLV